MLTPHWLTTLLSTLILALTVVGSAWPHDLGLARVVLRESEPGRYLLEAKLTKGGILIPPELPARCAVVGDTIAEHRRPTLVGRFVIRCAGVPLNAGDVLVLPWKLDGAFVKTHWSDGTSGGRFFEGRAGGIPLPVGLVRTQHRPFFETVRHYLVFGVEHILFGWDHLAFVLGLCLIARGRHLIHLVTAFTVGHSLTLGAAMLGLTRLPVPPVEACIALSIAFVARKVLIGETTSRDGIGLTFAFGLLHGLGFASALSDSGIQRSELLWGLVFFNIGVEFGQVAFVLAVLGLGYLARFLVDQPHRLRPALARTLGALALFWTIERVLGFVG